MELRVYHPNLLDQVCTVNSTPVYFDADGVSEPLSQEDYDTFRLIPSYEDYDPNPCPFIDEDFDTIPSEREVITADQVGTIESVANLLYLAANPDDEPECIEPHDPDTSLYEQFLVTTNMDFYGNLALVERLDLASDLRLTELEAKSMFEWESRNKKSKKCLLALDRRLALLRQSKSAESVTRSLLKTNFPVAEEQ